MKFRTLAIGYVLVLAVFLFAKSHVTPAQPVNGFSKVVDISRPKLPPGDPRATVLANYPAGLQTTTQIPASRLTAPLIVLEIESEMRKDPTHRVSVEDIADWELAHGEIPPNAIVVARTGLGSDAARSFPGYSVDAAQFLIEGRDILAIGSDIPMIDSSKTRIIGRYNTLEHSIYYLQNVANLEKVPARGSIVAASLPVQSRGKVIPVQLVAMVR